MALRRDWTPIKCLRPLTLTVRPFQLKRSWRLSLFTVTTNQICHDGAAASEERRTKNIQAVQYLNHLLGTLTASCIEPRGGGLTRFLKERSDIFISPREAPAPAASLLFWKKTFDSSWRGGGGVLHTKEIFASLMDFSPGGKDFGTLKCQKR